MLREDKHKFQTSFYKWNQKILNGKKSVPCWKKSWRTKQNLGYENKAIKCANIDGGEEGTPKKKMMKCGYCWKTWWTKTWGIIANGTL